MNDFGIHFCADTWPSGPAWEAFLDAFEAWARADERRVIEAEDTAAWDELRPLLASITNGRSQQELRAAREQCYERAAAMWERERARSSTWPDDANPLPRGNGEPISFEKRSAA